MVNIVFRINVLALLAKKKRIFCIYLFHIFFASKGQTAPRQLAVTQDEHQMAVHKEEMPDADDDDENNHNDQVIIAGL